MKNLFCLLAALFLASAASHTLAQSRLVLNGAKLVLSNGAGIVIDNQYPNAISGDSGGILCTGPEDHLIWKLGQTTGTYSIPFLSNSLEQLPVTFTKASGTGSGYYKLNTYATPTWENSLHLPAGVSNINDMYGFDNSGRFADRFWQISAVDYQAKPELTNLTFSFAESDYQAQGNVIEKTDLQPQQWNPDIAFWEEYYTESGVDETSNAISIQSLPPDYQYSYWSLASSSPVTPLPVNFISFTAMAGAAQAYLFWDTSSEENNDYFVIERSADGKRFEKLSKVKGAGNSHRRNTYSATDIQPLPGVSYYRIKQVDFDGTASYTPVRSVSFSSAEATLVSFPNPATNYQVLNFSNWQKQTVSVQLTDLQGRILVSRRVNLQGGVNESVQVNFPDLGAGAYFLIVSGTEKTITQKLLIQN